MKTDERGRWWPRLLTAVACATALAVAAPGTASAAPPPSAAPAPSATASASAGARDAGARSAAAQAAAQRAAAKQAATAQRAAARTADAAQKAQSTWSSHGRPTALVIVRPTGIDLVTQGRLTRRIPRSTGTMTLATLDRFLPSGWLSITGGTARLSAAVVLTPGVTLDVGAPVTTLWLAGGATAADAASIYTGSGGLTVHGVTVSSADRTSGQTMPPGPGRPFLLVSPGGRLTATDATLSDLGTVSADTRGSADVEAHPGVDFRAGSTGSLVRTSLLRNDTGLVLDGSQGVHLEDVTLSGSTGDGLVLRGDRGTTMSGIRAERNGAYGVRVVGPNSDRPVTGITATGNGAFGIGIDRQTGVHLTGVTTSANGSGGVDVSQSSKIAIADLTATDEPAGVFTHVNSTGITLDRFTSTGGRRAVLVEKTTHQMTVQASTITGAAVAGVAVGGTDIALRDLTVTGSRTGVRVERGAAGVTATGIALSGGQDGVVAGPGTTGVVLQDLRVNGVADDAVRSSSPDARIVGGRIDGGTTGIYVDAPTTISGTTIGLVDQGIRTYSPGLVHADDIEVDAVSVGINSAPGSPLLLTGSRVHALEAVRGTVDEQGANDLSLPPLNLLGAIGIPLILLALGLQALAALRGRRFGGDARRTPPVLRANAAASADRATPESANPAPKAVRAGRAGSSVGSAHAA